MPAQLASQLGLMNCNTPLQCSGGEETAPVSVWQLHPICILTHAAIGK